MGHNTITAVLSPPLNDSPVALTILSENSPTAVPASRYSAISVIIVYTY